jgi:hypothetical protein
VRNGTSAMHAARRLLPALLAALLAALMGALLAALMPAMLAALPPFLPCARPLPVLLPCCPPVPPSRAALPCLAPIRRLPRVTGAPPCPHTLRAALLPCRALPSRSWRRLGGCHASRARRSVRHAQTATCARTRSGALLLLLCPFRRGCCYGLAVPFPPCANNCVCLTHLRIGLPYCTRAQQTADSVTHAACVCVCVGVHPCAPYAVSSPPCPAPGRRSAP